MGPAPILGPRDALRECIARVYARGLTTSLGGNASVLGRGGDVWITPAGVDKAVLSRSDIVCVARDGSWRGSVPPSSELPLHRAIYDSRPDVSAVLHAHPAALVAFSVARCVPDTRVLRHACATCGECVLAPYRPPGSDALAGVVAASVQGGADCVLLENHGVVVAGRDLREAFVRFETLELTARTILCALDHGGELRVSSGEPSSAEAMEGEGEPAEDDPAARTVCEFVRRGYRRRLFGSASGILSVRLDDGSFLITPSAVDRAAIEPRDVRRFGIEAAAHGPARTHAAVYRRHPWVRAIATAAPAASGAFACVHDVPDVAAITEGLAVVRGARLVSGRLQHEDPDGLAQLISPACPVLILENDGVLVAGADPLETVERLEALDLAAQALLHARRLRGAGAIHASTAGDQGLAIRRAAAVAQ